MQENKTLGKNVLTRDILEIEIIKPDLAIGDFGVGKITAWKEWYFLFDIYNPGMVQVWPNQSMVSPGRLDLKKIAGIQQIDGILFNKDTLLITDSLGQSLCRLEIEINKEGVVTLDRPNHYRLPPGSLIHSIIAHEKGLLLMDKGLSLLRLLDGNYQETRTIGSRMGYMYDLGETGFPRLGFEFPGDMASIGKGVMVADSGNQRVVVLDGDLKQEKVIPLPGFPFKILLVDESQRYLAVSDFDRSLMVVSLDHGFVGEYTFSEAVDFFPSFYMKNEEADSGGIPYCLTGTEKTDSIELIKISFAGLSLEEIATRGRNWKVLLREKLGKGEYAQARELVVQQGDLDLKLEYARGTTGDDDYVDSSLIKEMEVLLPEIIEENERVYQKIESLGEDFFLLYKKIPVSQDKEAESIKKENIRHEMFLEIKRFRANLRKILHLGEAIKNHGGPTLTLKALLNGRFERVKKGLTAHLENLEEILERKNENELLKMMISFWFLAEEEKVWFKEEGYKYEKILGDEFLLAILNDFYFHVSLLYLDRGKRDLYIHFCDREISMYTDKTGVIDHLVRHLISFKQYPDVFRLLGKFTDQNRENVNYYYYQVYMQQGELDKALKHIKKELDLFPHRFELIPMLIGLNRMERDEVESYIRKILEKSGQSIDMYLNAASAFQAIGNDEAARHWVNKELELFPENQNAVIFKINLLLRIDRGAREELQRLVRRIKAPHLCLTRGKVYFALGEYGVCWQELINFLGTATNERVIKENEYLTGVLNELPVSRLLVEDILGKLSQMDEKFGGYKRAFLVYLSFLKYIAGENLVQELELERYEADTYLAIGSTKGLAYRHYYKQLEEWVGEKKWDEAIALAKQILKYNPGDGPIFDLLDSTG